MKVSNFAWTDKISQKWFILFSQGHEGPYSLQYLMELYQTGKLKPDSQIWSEGLDAPEEFQILLLHQNPLPENSRERETDLIEETENDLPPPVPVIREKKILLKNLNKYKLNLKVPKSKSLVLSLSLCLVGLLSFYLVKLNEKFYFSRLPKMSREMHQRILSENSFQGWNKELFFREYLSKDHSHIWLVTSAFQNCNIQLSFKSVKDKLISLEVEDVVFRSSGILRNHVAEFSSFDFRQGKKIIPGIYEMDIEASDCHRSGFLPSLMNLFNPDEKHYFARTRAILHPSVPENYHKNLLSLIKKKQLINQKKNKFKKEAAPELDQKFQTLLAISHQIEDHFLNFLQPDKANGKTSIQSMIDGYSKNFGSFLTVLVMNDQKLTKITTPELQDKLQKQQSLIESMSRLIGFESMQLIESFQQEKNLSRPEVAGLMAQKVKEVFARINKKIVSTHLPLTGEGSVSTTQ